MRTNVIFRHPAEFVPLSYEDGILATGGARWFVGLLHRIPGLWVDDNLCQEDWGVVIFVRRERSEFWIGLSLWPEEEQLWLAHCHQRGWVQRVTSSGKRALGQLVMELHTVLTNESAVSAVGWYEERQMASASPQRYATPAGD